VSQFNQVRFFAKLRKTDLESDEEYRDFLKEIKRFNELSEQLFNKRVIDQASRHSQM